MKVIAAEVAAHLGMSRKAATESQATTGEMASTKAAAHASAAAEPAAHMCAAAAEPAAHMTATAEPAPVSTSPAAARKAVGGQYPGESGSRQQHDRGFTYHGDTPSDATIVSLIRSTRRHARAARTVWSTSDPLLIDARANYAAGRSLARDAGLMVATRRTVLESLGTTRA
jgi:hypothetical protein